MHAPADHVASSRPVLMRLLVRSWEYRRPRLWVGVRLACGIFNVVLGVLLLASVRWLGPLTWLAALPLAGAALIFWTVYRLQQDSIRRVRELEQFRARVVDDSAARLRRIERDLHDGAQAQMVAVAMKLGLAREKLGGTIAGTTVARTAKADLERVLELVDAAHRGAKEAITELRDLARGIHPPVSTRRCSTAASAPRSPPSPRAARCPSSWSSICPSGPRPRSRPSPTSARRNCSPTSPSTAAPGMPRWRQSTCRGCCGCGSATMGTGGARLEARGGLAGLADRVRTVDGRLQVSSPPGGPTVIAVELPSHA